jgi:hypothetical protein
VMSMAWKAVIESIRPIGEVEVGRWDSKKDAESQMYTEFGMHWQRFLEPERDVDVVLKLKEVVE